MSHGRTVVVLCGPAGAGKTTLARLSGLTVYDRDDPEWQSEKHFTTKLADLAKDPRARAVVIRSGATSSARMRAAKLTGATHVFVVLAEPKVCQQRVIERGRADRIRGVASVPRWFADFDRMDGVKDFPGWAEIEGASLALGNTSEEW